MTIEKTDGIWAETGEKTSSYTAEKKSAGYVAGDQPSKQDLNFLFNRIDEKIDTIIKERVNSYYEDAADHQAMIATGLWDESWGNARDSVNIISGGSTKKYKFLKVYFDSNNQAKLLVTDDTNFKFEIWDPRDNTLEDTSDAWTDDLPSPTGSWLCVGFCTDNTSIYGLFQDSGGTSPVQIQAWDISTWDVKTGWGSTGTQITSSGSIAPGLQKLDLLIMASSTRLATLNPWTTISASTSDAISIINISTGTIVDSAAGDAPTAVSAKASGGICSDGTNVFFAAYESSTQYHLCSATIANPQTGCGGTGFPRSLTANFESNALISCGPELIVCILDRSSGTEVATDEVILTFNSSAANKNEILLGQNSASTPVLGEDLYLGRCLGGVFDGINLWLYGATNTNLELTLIKIDAAKLSWLTAVGNEQLGDICSYFKLNSTYYTASDNLSLIFDGRDIWYIIEQRSSQTHSGEIIRFPIAFLRS